MPGINLGILLFDILCSENRLCIGNRIQVKLLRSLHAVLMPTLKVVSGVHLAASIRSRGVHVSFERNGLSSELRFLAALASWASQYKTSLLLWVCLSLGIPFALDTSFIFCM